MFWQETTIYLVDPDNLEALCRKLDQLAEQRAEEIYRFLFKTFDFNGMSSSYTYFLLDTVDLEVVPDAHLRRDLQSALEQVCTHEAGVRASAYDPCMAEVLEPWHWYGRKTDSGDVSYLLVVGPTEEVITALDKRGFSCKPLPA